MQLLHLLITLGAAVWLLWEVPYGPLLAIAGILVLLVVVALRAVQAALPRALVLEPAGDVVLGDWTLRTVAALQELGCEPLGEIWRANSRPTPVIVPMVMRTCDVLVMVYELQLPQPRTMFDLVTLFPNGKVLTTSAFVEAGSLPAMPGNFLQILPGADAATLLSAHREAIGHLAARAQPPCSLGTLTAADAGRHLCSFLAEQRACFDAAPLRTGLVALWRTLTRRTPHLGRLLAQVDGVAPTPARA
ncbi:MAG: hypothetical protein U1E73_07230 [Planctomycetota bacterium]